MKKAREIFEVLKAQLHSNDFANTHKTNPKAFVRCRLLPFQTLCSFVLNLLNQSIPKELNIFSNHLQTERPTRSAVTQARKKLLPQAFISLNDTLINEFYHENDFKTFQGFITLAIDGSTIQLPDSPELIEMFGHASNQTENQLPMARISTLYDTLNGLILDAKIKPYNASERDIAIEHLEAIKCLKIDLERILIIFDRGYPSISLIYYMQQNGINFIIRSGTGFLKEVNEIANSNKTDEVLEISYKRVSSQVKKELLLLFPNMSFTKSSTCISFRVVIVKLKTGEKETLLTSLICKKNYPHRIFHDLYFFRWRIEEGYKFCKSGLEIENFSGKSCLVIEQDFYATVLVANAHALLSLEAKQEIQNLPKKTVKKYDYNVNKRVSISSLKNIFVEMLLNTESDVEGFCEGVKKTMKRDLIPIRPGRSFQRLRKHTRRKYHMNQR
jgi:hypothetical protein